MRLFKICATLTTMCCSMFLSNVSVFAASAGDVVINEIAWAGSMDSASDEWIELFNASGASVDLSGWSIEDDDGASVYNIVSGNVDANGYFLIESREEATDVVGDLVTGLSLANAGDKLVLKDAAGNVIDTVNSGGGAWVAGGSTTKATMERIDAGASGDDANNWNAGVAGGALASGGSTVVGSPKGLNSGSSLPVNMPKAELKISNGEPRNGDVVSVVAEVSNMTDLFSYGFDVTYDSAVLKFVSAGERGFLSENGAVSTSFQAGLESGVEGRVVVGGARTENVKSTVSGLGELFVMEFEVIGNEGDKSAIGIGPGSFLASDVADIGAGFLGGNIMVVGAAGSGGPVTGMIGKENANRYELEVSWEAPVEGADTYKVFRKNASGIFVEVGNVGELSFVDKDGVSGGGNIVPGVEYVYKVVAVKGGVESAGVEVAVTETRGLKGDNTRSDRVDGRDLDNLAKHFGEESGVDGFDSLVDTNYDGSIDGSDLIDLAAQWAKKYQV